MDITYTWTVDKLTAYRTKDIYVDVVNWAKITCTGTTTVNGAPVSASTQVDSTWNTNLDGQVFIPYDQLTEAIVLQKCFSTDVNPQVVEAQVAQLLWNKINIVELPLPWI